MRKFLIFLIINSKNKYQYSMKSICLIKEDIFSRLSSICFVRKITAQINCIDSSRYLADIISYPKSCEV